MLRLLSFIGALTWAGWRGVRGVAHYRRRDLWLFLRQCGPDALPIVMLISFLIGLILAFVGANQLRVFGAEIFVANLVGLSMSREMAAMMTAVIMAGRTGAAFAAQIGTMQVKEELDALTVMGISPLEFLVLPRVIALVILMPLLTIYANLMGMFGGAVVALALFDIPFVQYADQLRVGVAFLDVLLGLFKALVYGALVALAGCYHGIYCGRSAAAVGEATTAAVVASIVLIVVASAILTVIYQILGF